MGPLLIAVLLGLTCAVLVLQPLFGLDRASEDAQAAEPTSLAEVAERERLAKQALLEVDFDHRLGNLADADYADLRARYERRALVALKTRYQRERALDDLIDHQLDNLRKQDTSVKRNGKPKRQITQPVTVGAESEAAEEFDAPVATASAKNGSNGHTPASVSIARNGHINRPRRRKGGV